ncbi:MAG: FAD:protein FMN transferase [Mycobacteriaceae bacterium]
MTQPGMLTAAHRIVRDHLAAVEKACSRFRGDSEITGLARRLGASTRVSPLLAEFLHAAVRAAELTHGDVDPTVGAALADLGYDRDFSLIAHAQTSVQVMRRRPADWTMLSLRDGVVTVPEGVQLDLGATAKALSADQCARRVSDRLGCGVLISLGGDIATAGAGPVDGWQVLVCDGPGQPSSAVSLPDGGALATSSTQRRRWSRAGRDLHHVIDPRTAQPAQEHWRTVSIVAGSCVEANTISTACIVRARAAREWLGELGHPARLVDRGGGVHLLNGWPASGGRAA